MKHYKDENNKIYAFESDNEMKKFRPGLTPITKKEKDDLLAPTQEQINEKRKLEIYSRLSQIDQESIRPSRAKLNGTNTQADDDKLSELEAEAQTLRDELAQI